MKLLHCHIENFGKLSDVDINFEEDLCIMNRPNGWGKSTLANYIKIMFFGFNSDNKRSIAENERKKYSPWNNNTFGGSLSFEKNHIKYIIYRTFGKKASEDSFELRFLETNLLSNDYSENIGEELFGVDKKSFERTVFIGQKDCKTIPTDRINGLLGRFLDNTDDINNYESAQLFLKNKINETDGKKNGRLFKLKEKISECKSNINITNGNNQRILNKSGLIEDYEKQLFDLEKAYESNSKEYEKQNETKQESIKYREFLKIKERLANAKKQLMEDKSFFKENLVDRETVKEYKKKNNKLKKLRLNIQNRIIQEEIYEAHNNKRENIKYDNGYIINQLGIIVFILVCLALGIYIIDKEKYIGIFMIVVSFVITLLILFSHKRKKICEVNENGKHNNKKFNNSSYELDKLIQEADELSDEIGEFIYEYISDDEIFEEEEDYDEAINSLILAINNYDRSYEIFEQIKLEYDAYLSENSFIREYEKSREVISYDNIYNLGNKRDDASELKNNIAQIYKKIGELKKLIEKEKIELEKIKAQTKDIESLEQEYSKLIAEKEQIEHENMIAKLTSMHLTRAKENLTKKYMSPIKHTFDNYYGMINDYMDYDYLFDANIDVKSMEDGKLRDISLLSDGRQDLIGICLRMAMVESMYDEDRPMLIFDDPFTNFDEEKVNNAMIFLKEISKRFQVIYFTCHKSRSI